LPFSFEQQKKIISLLIFLLPSYLPSSLLTCPPPFLPVHLLPNFLIHSSSFHVEKWEYLFKICLKYFTFRIWGQENMAKPCTLFCRDRSPDRRFAAPCKLCWSHLCKDSHATDFCWKKLLHTHPRKILITKPFKVRHGLSGYFQYLIFSLRCFERSWRQRSPCRLTFVRPGTVGAAFWSSGKSCWQLATSHQTRENFSEGGIFHEGNFSSNKIYPMVKYLRFQYRLEQQNIKWEIQ